MKKFSRRKEILKQFLSDAMILDEAVMVPEYNFAEDCLMAPFYIVIQALKSLNYTDTYYTHALLEELDSFKVPLLMEKLVNALFAMEKGEMGKAESLLEKLDSSFLQRPTPGRYYLLAMDSVYRADYRLFTKWYPLAHIRFLIYSENRTEDKRITLSKYKELAVASGVEESWVNRYELKARMSYYRKTRNIAAQEREIGLLLEDYEARIASLNISSPSQSRKVKRQNAFIIQQMFQLIEQYEQSLEHQKTLFWCDQILLLQPKSQKSLVTKIEALKKMKRYQCALGFCNAFISNDPRDSIGYYLRSNTYFLMKETHLAYQDAQDCYQRTSDKKTGLLARGFSLLNLADYGKAAGCFEVVCSMGNPSYEALRGLGKSYASQDRTIKALECYTQCKRIDPVDVDLLYDIADTLFMGGYFTEAKKTCLECLAICPSSVGVHVILGMIALREENENQALHFFDRTLELDPNNPYALNEKGFLFHLSGDDDKAAKFIDQALLEFPEYADALCNRGIICCMSGEYEDAIENFSKALQIVPEHLGASLGTANILLHESRFAEALDWFEKILNTSPDNEEANTGRNTVYKLMGLSSEAYEESP